MKTLVVYYSRTGNTKKVAEDIAKELKADVDEIKDKAKREGFFNYFKSGYHAARKKLTEIGTAKDPFKYDLVIIGTPVWSWTVTPAVRTYMDKNEFKKVAFFCTCGGQKGKTFEEMEKLSKKPLAKLEIKEKQIPKSEHLIKKFCVYLR
ncbi:flavodoxin [Candidatus Woesearchaeota archaeon]|nr:flavodoxin [Candidatus Woesearchaeota archaeon]